jgi:hypothetical protein
MSGKNNTPPKDCCNDCSDQQASLISADVGAQALGINVCVDVDIGGGLDLGHLPLPDCISDVV